MISRIDKNVCLTDVELIAVARIIKASWIYKYPELNNILNELENGLAHKNTLFENKEISYGDSTIKENTNEFA